MAGFGITPDEIQVWWMSIEGTDSRIEDLRRILDDSERVRADRFRVAAARRRFIGARAFLRSILGGAIAVEPENVAFSHGRHGKPRLADGGPHFNATDSGDTVVVALASDEIGIDVEVARRLRRFERLARRICTDREIEALERMSPRDRDAALLRLWTCKEAGLKAIGTGLSGGMRNVEVDLEPGRPPRLRRLCGEADGWALSAVDITEDLLCTVVVKGKARRLVCRRRQLPLAGTNDVC